MGIITSPLELAREFRCAELTKVPPSPSQISVEQGLDLLRQEMQAQFCNALKLILNDFYGMDTTSTTPDVKIVPWATRQKGSTYNDFFIDFCSTKRTEGNNALFDQKMRESLNKYFADFGPLAQGRRIQGGFNQHTGNFTNQFAGQDMLEALESLVLQKAPRKADAIDAHLAMIGNIIERMGYQDFTPAFRLH